MMHGQKNIKIYRIVKKVPKEMLGVGQQINSKTLGFS
jgi:hypothetical protein